jgi:hypothetical protein
MKLLKLAIIMVMYYRQDSSKIQVGGFERMVETNMLLYIQYCVCGNKKMVIVELEALQ